MILPKLKRLIKRIFNRTVIHNYQYKPKGVYKTVEEYTAKTKGAKTIEAFPAYTSYLDVSEEFRKHFITYVDTTSVAQIPASKVVMIPNGRVHTDNNFSIAIISENNYLIGEISYDVHNDEPSKNNIFRQRYFHSPKKYSGTVCSLLIGEGGIVNYSHFLIDSLSRIALLKKTGLFESVDWFLVPSYQFDFQKDALQMLGLPVSKIIRGDLQNHVQADRIIATTYVRYHEHIPKWCTQFLRSEFLNFNSLPSSKTYHEPYVYISRNDSPKRRVLNEPELVKMLEKYGFVTFELSKLSFREKISLFAHAKLIVATIGAGQCNLVFCEERASVIELLPEDFAMPFFNDVANKVGMHYEHLICKADGRARTFKQGEKLNLIADIDVIEKKVQRILASQAMTVLQ